MRKRKILIAILLIVVILVIRTYLKGSVYIPYYNNNKLTIVEWVFRDVNKGNIIGNPNFTPSFDQVSNETFLTKFNSTLDYLEYSFDIESIKSKNGFSSSYSIDGTFSLFYSEGFIIVSFKDIDESKQKFNDLLHALIITLDDEVNEEELENYFSEVKDLDFLDYNKVYIDTNIDYRFYHDGFYEVHVEDRKMGH